MASSVGSYNGSFGAKAAAAYKDVPSADRHSTSVRYTKNFYEKGASQDLAAYVDSFKKQDGTFGEQEIENATGLDPKKLGERNALEKLWDLNGDGKVDEKEMFAGVGQLDTADSWGVEDVKEDSEQGKANGEITEKGRKNVEALLNPEHEASPNSERSMPLQRQNQFIHGNTTSMPPTQKAEAVADALGGLNLDQLNEDEQLNAILGTLSQHGPGPSDTFNAPPKNLPPHLQKQREAHYDDPNKPEDRLHKLHKQDKLSEELEGQNMQGVFARQQADLLQKQGEDRQKSYQSQIAGVAKGTQQPEQYWKHLDLQG
jgi:hypothetical protein